MGCLQSKEQKLAAEINREFERWLACPGAAPDARDAAAYRALYDDVCAGVPVLVAKIRGGDAEFKELLKAVIPDGAPGAGDGRTTLDDLRNVPEMLRLARREAEFEMLPEEPVTSDSESEAAPPRPGALALVRPKPGWTLPTMAWLG